MIISASRRTDIPAFYAEWFKNRIEQGYCEVVNPFNRSQVRRVSLLPQDVDIFIFWTRNAQPLLSFLKHLDKRGYVYAFLYTLTAYGNNLEPNMPDRQRQIDRLKALSEYTGSPVIWRYDPILLTSRFDINYHLDQFACLADKLTSCVQRVIISPIDLYAKTRKNLQGYSKNHIFEFDAEQNERLFSNMAKIAAENHLQIQSCASRIDLRPFGIPVGKCIDDDFINNTFAIRVNHQKDPGQRKACRCVKSVDIGRYNTCIHGCLYCYAVQSLKQAQNNYLRHDPTTPAL